MRTIVVGIGNPVLGDDAVGIHIVRALKEHGVGPDTVIEEAYTGGMNLLDLILGYDRALLVDAVSFPEMEMGRVMVIDPMKMPSAHSTNPHDVSFPEAIEIARRTGEERIPGDIVLVAINVPRSFELTESLSPEIVRSIPFAMNEVLVNLS